MDLGQGEIYFIAERDGSSNTGFIKIGLVRERDGRDSYDRIKEHQTGNPRSLELLNVVKTVLVSTVENTLHREYAGRRVSGEWFKLDQPALADAVARCRVLAETYAAHIPALEAASALEGVESVQEMLPATDESRAWQIIYLKAKAGVKLIDTATKSFQEFLGRLHDTGTDVSHIATIKELPGSQRFDESVFKERFPDLWQQHLLSTTVMGRSSLRVTPLTSTSFDNADELGETRSVAQLLDELQGREKSDHAALSEMHGNYLQLIGHEALFDEQVMLAGAYLKMLCGNHEGIDGVCKWKREMEPKSVLDKATIKERYAAEFSQCLVAGAPARRINIIRGIGGIPGEA